MIYVAKGDFNITKYFNPDDYVPNNDREIICILNMFNKIYTVPCKFDNGKYINDEYKDVTQFVMMWTEIENN